MVEDDDEDDEERVLNQRDERLWRNIFAIFDDDGSGTISLEEMGSIMRDLCGCTANHQEIAHVLSLLDENHNGELDFDEFYFFVKKMEKYVAAEETPERIVSEMFDLIDTDASGEITVAELQHDAEAEAGLGVDDIYEMMKDFDEDGGASTRKSRRTGQARGDFGEEKAAAESVKARVLGGPAAFTMSTPEPPRSAGEHSDSPQRKRPGMAPGARPVLGEFPRTG